jgi:hypothetical protein
VHLRGDRRGVLLLAEDAERTLAVAPRQVAKKFVDRLFKLFGTMPKLAFRNKNVPVVHAKIGVIIRMTLGGADR